MILAILIKNFNKLFLLIHNYFEKKILHNFRTSLQANAAGLTNGSGAAVGPEGNGLNL